MRDSKMKRSEGTELVEQQVLHLRTPHLQLYYRVNAFNTFN